MLNDDFYANEVDIMLNENIDFWSLNLLEKGFLYDCLVLKHLHVLRISIDQKPADSCFRMYLFSTKYE